MLRLSREAMRAAYATPSSSTSLAHGSSGPMSLQLPMYRSQHQPPEPAPVTGLLGGQQPTSNLSAPVYGVPVPVGYKRPAMLSSEYGLSSGRRALLEPLKIDTELKKVLSDVLVLFHQSPVFTARCVCVARTVPWQDVCLSVCHTPVLCLNGYTYPQSFFIVG